MKRKELSHFFIQKELGYCNREHFDYYSDSEVRGLASKSFHSNRCCFSLSIHSIRCCFSLSICSFSRWGQRSSLSSELRYFPQWCQFLLLFQLGALPNSDIANSYMIGWVLLLSSIPSRVMSGILLIHSSIQVKVLSVLVQFASKQFSFQFQENTLCLLRGSGDQKRVHQQFSFLSCKQRYWRRESPENQQRRDHILDRDQKVESVMQVEFPQIDLG